ncbi:hypothetical protein [Kitasatospora sp. NPDC001527]|uniref:hypothetical protein n=1 Tax=Kitasatospora sp. NPDC001527 TaxID=3154519 RepID=UPI00331EB374
MVEAVDSGVTAGTGPAGWHVEVPTDVIAFSRGNCLPQQADRCGTFFNRPTPLR